MSRRTPGTAANTRGARTAGVARITREDNA